MTTIGSGLLGSPSSATGELTPGAPTPSSASLLPLAYTLGTSASTAGNMFCAYQKHIDPDPSYYLTPMISVVVTDKATGGIYSLQSQVLSVDITYGLDIGISSATVELTENPRAPNNSLSEYSLVQIYAGVDPQGPNYRALRFTGILLRIEANLWPHTYSLVCRGMLYYAQQFQQPFGEGWDQATSKLGLPFGRAMTTFTWTDGSVIQGILDTATGSDQEIIQSVLATVPNLAPFLDNVNINGTGKRFGVISYLLMFWPPYRTALEYAQQFDQVCLGYRLYESLGGKIHRDIIYGYPSSIADTTFTEGIDIWEGKGTRSVEQLVNASFVEGAVAPGNSITAAFAFVQSSNPFQPSTAPTFSEGFPQPTPGWNPIADRFQSPLIETSDLMIAAGENVDALSANDVARWRLSERNRELVNTSFVTFRDDLLFPGRTIAVNTPHMAVTEPQWLQRVNIRAQSKPPLFQQTIYTIGGGTPAYGWTAIVQTGSTTTDIIVDVTLTPDALIGQIVSFQSGDNLGQQVTVTANTDTTITVNPPFGNTPTPGEIILIGDYKPPLSPPFNN